MYQREYEDIWRSPDKCVNDDIAFAPRRGCINIFDFDGIEVINSTVEGLLIGGHYNCNTGAVTFNMHIRGVGAISRYCVGGTRHGDVGRYHQHSIRKDEDIRRHLPHAVRRDDLRGLTARRVWETPCTEACITHVGTFFDPEEMCK